MLRDSAGPAGSWDDAELRRKLWRVLLALVSIASMTDAADKDVNIRTCALPLACAFGCPTIGDQKTSSPGVSPNSKDELNFVP